MVTATSLRDRIARALYNEGASCGECRSYSGWDSCDECRRHVLDLADAVLAVLADADPTDLGYERVGIIREDDHIIRWDRGCRIARVIERPVYARRRTEETPDA